MKRLFAKHGKRTPALPARLSWCEPVWASPTSAHHIRIVPEGQELVLGGGLSDLALCGRSMDRGWDTHAVKGPDEIRGAIKNSHESNRTCAKCAEAAFAWYEVAL